MRSISLETEGKMILVIKWQRTWHNFIPFFVKVELVSDELGI
jgi:hypothetical protein